MTRTTSSSQNPSTQLPFPERVLNKRTKKATEELRKLDGNFEPHLADWHAPVSKVMACDFDDYDDGRGLEKVFEYTKEVS